MSNNNMMYNRSSSRNMAVQSSSNNGNNSTTNGPRAKCDQVVFEALCKACEIIVGSRTTLHGAGSNSGSGSTRFNLQIPEVAGVRNILAQYRLQLHVPIRLDVYYQHPPPPEGSNGQQQQQGRRELLERWCLEYKSVSSERFLEAEGIITNDPMVQLTHVCKRVVIWLRTLYCWTRLLPAQAVLMVSSNNNNQIGFSVYANTDESDDISDLKNQQGFLMQGQQPQQQRTGSNGGVVTTPYGELAWQVLYCQPSYLERLVPNITRSPTSVRIQAPSRPIPMPKQPPPQQQQMHQPLSTFFAPHSAPSTRDRPQTYTERSKKKHLAAQQQQQQHQKQQHQNFQSGKSYDPNRMHQRTRETTGLQQQQQQQQQTGGLLGKGISAINSQPQNKQQQQQRQTSPKMPSNGNRPERVLSGLSLALMMASNDDDNITGTENGEATATENGIGGSWTEEKMPTSSTHDNSNSDDEGAATTVTERARRAALHEMPPHLLGGDSSPNHPPVPSPLAAATSGEYGYGYNNHIPWQKIHPSNTNPAVIQERSIPSPSNFGRTLSSSPVSFASPVAQLTPSAATPPGAAFVGATSPMGSLGHLIPPRTRSDSKTITPPFQPRPAGFLHDAPAIPLEPQGATMSTMNGTAESVKSPAASLKPGMSALDSLRHSPFQQQQQQSLHPDTRASMLSSLSFAPGFSSDLNVSSLQFGSEQRASLWGKEGGGGLVLPPSLPGSAGLLQYEDYLPEDMPFAVEIPSDSSAQLSFGSSVASQKQSGSASKQGASVLGNSSALASLAQKCAAPSQLKLFEQQASEKTGATEEREPSNTASSEDLVASLTDQLQEFRAFGASLHQSADGEQLRGSGTSSSSTPISLRT